MLPFNFHDHVKAGFLLAFMLFLCYNNTRVVFAESPETLLLVFIGTFSDSM